MPEVPGKAWPPLRGAAEAAHGGNCLGSRSCPGRVQRPPPLTPWLSFAELYRIAGSPSMRFPIDVIVDIVTVNELLLSNDLFMYIKK